MKILQALQQPSKIFIEFWDHKKSVDVAKLQTGMLRLMYAGGKIDWDKGTVKSLRLAIFFAGLQKYVQQISHNPGNSANNLFMTIFTIEPVDENDNTPLNPLNRLMSLVVFSPKVMKGHLNASFQSVELKSGTIYKSTSKHPFHYAPQNNCMLVKMDANKMEEEQNEINWCIVDKDREQISWMIERVGRVNLMEDIAIF
jgi:hypothetical protein